MLMRLCLLRYEFAQQYAHYYEQYRQAFDQQRQQAATQPGGSEGQDSTASALAEAYYKGVQAGEPDQTSS